MRIVISLVGLLLLAACGDSPTEPDTLEGTYHLVLAGGNPLPYRINKTEPITDLTGGTLTLMPDRTFTMVETFRAVSTGQTYTNARSGSYLQRGSEIEFYFNGYGGPNATYSSGTITFSTGSVFRKR